MQAIIGRANELEKLREVRRSFCQKGSANLVVIKGRRRIGKSRWYVGRPKSEDLSDPA